MVMFVPVDPANLNTNRLGRRGRVSYPILKSFMEANMKLAKLDLAGLDKNPNYLRSVLTSYIRSHNLPIKLFSSAGDLHLMRIDLRNDGTPDPNYVAGPSRMDEEYRGIDEDRPTEGAAGHLRDIEVKDINPTEVAERFAIEVGKTTK